MCIIQGVTDRVQNTQIFVCELETKKIQETKRQITVYSNEVSVSKNENVAMILPVPSCNNGDIEIVDMSENKDLFKKFQDYFWFRGSRGSSCSFRRKSFLEIKQHGSYDVSIVPSLQDFEHLNHEYFILDHSIAELLKRDYSDGFGFIVCKLRENAEYHPFGYTHPMKNNNFFAPTKHFHNNSEKHADWDHAIYYASDKQIKKHHKNGIYEFSRKNAVPIPLLVGLKDQKLLFDSYFNKIVINDKYELNYDFIITRDNLLTPLQPLRIS